MLEARSITPNGRHVTARTRFMPAVVEHLIPRENRESVATGLSDIAAWFGNADIYIHGRDNGNGAYELSTTIDVSQNGALCSAAHATQMTNYLSSFFTRPRPVPNVHLIPPGLSRTPSHEFPRASWVGNILRTIGNNLAFMFDLIFDILRSCAFSILGR